ncbi:Hypothetical predicted protein [Pelobates cultripes]|uniref:Uncharacterized protein n=1 Tax=Pelobates cultripes TaxID=61616 RepID=A0AAD1R2N8_PELCU|nr:Hypothetical predicted protein [Pelobates cultripes]
MLLPRQSDQVLPAPTTPTSRPIGSSSPCSNNSHHAVPATRVLPAATTPVMLFQQHTVRDYSPPLQNWSFAPTGTMRPLPGFPSLFLDQTSVSAESGYFPAT